MYEKHSLFNSYYFGNRLAAGGIYLQRCGVDTHTACTCNNIAFAGNYKAGVGAGSALNGFTNL